MSAIAEIVQELGVDRPGWARLVVPCALPDGGQLRASFRRNSQPPWLGDGEWGDNLTWHALNCAGRDDGRVEISVPPALNEKLVNTTIEVSVETSDGAAAYRLYWLVPVLAGAAQAGATHETALKVQHDTHPQMPANEAVVEHPNQERSTREGLAQDAVEPVQEPGPAQASEPELEAQAHSTTPSPVPAQPGKPFIRTLLVRLGALGALAVLAAAVWTVAVWWYLDGGQMASPTAPTVVAAPKVGCNNDAIKEWLADKAPAAVVIRELAERCQKDGDEDIAKKLYRRAAHEKDPQAALVVARWFDPETFAAEGRQVSRPSAESAARYYKIAAEAGVPQAQYRYGVLLYQGATDAQTGPEQGIEFIKRAAAAGDQDAIAFMHNQRKSP